jgi:ABC-type histidine transport system ATPase subunit
MVRKALQIKAFVAIHRLEKKQAKLAWARASVFQPELMMTPGPTSAISPAA